MLLFVICMDYRVRTELKQKKKIKKNKKNVRLTVISRLLTSVREHQKMRLPDIALSRRLDTIRT